MHRATNNTLGRAFASGGRRQLSEESVTYKLMDLVDDFSDLGCPIWIRDFGRAEESSNGADVELWFWDQLRGEALGWLVQAKRLSPPRTAAASPVFASVDHNVRGTPQVDLLMNTAAAEVGLVPLYWLYSWDFAVPTLCTGQKGCKCTPGSFDDSLIVAPAALVAAQKSRSWHGMIGRNRGHVEPLRRLWCHSGGSVAGLAQRTRDLLVGRAIGTLAPTWRVAEAPPRYVREVFRFDQASNDVEVSGASTARHLAVFLL